MEPVKGGELVNLPKEADEILRQLNNGSNASFAIRFAASYDGVIMVLSGMSNIEQMRDNLSYMKDFIPFNDEEYKAVFKVAEIIKQHKLIPCTGCRYCVDGCVKNIEIPEIFANLNKKILNKDFDPLKYDQIVLNKGKASDCIKCGRCENECPQHLPIRELLEKIAREFE
jgi:predicted aldo/keto reductase-like oxidoreductase